jgi:hypothetical protein
MENGISLGIADSEFKSGKRISIFPNPGTGSEINIRIFSRQPEDLTMTVYELSGKKTGLNKYIRAKAGVSSYILPVEVLENGMYILSITGKDWSGYEPIVIIR